ncbi:MAG: hypothetical protein ACREMY_08555, partial [bacterium]
RSHLESIVALILASAGSVGCPDMQFSRFHTATRVVVSVDSNPVGTIEAPAKIASLASFADAHRAGWSVPGYGPPIARLRAEFYAGGKFLGDLGTGVSFLSAQGCGDFQSRGVAESDRQRFVELLGVGDPYKSGGK